MSFVHHAEPRTAAGPISAAEQRARLDLAAAYRLVALDGLDDLIYTHLSVAVPGEPGHFLINPFGLAFEEVCASNLVKIDLAGRCIGDGPHQVNATGFALHAAVHAARADAVCVIHLHAKAGIAVSMQPQGLLPARSTRCAFTATWPATTTRRWPSRRPKARAWSSGSATSRLCCCAITAR